MTFPADSTVPAFIDALVAGVSFDPSVFVFGGPKLQWPKSDFVVFGWGSPAVEQEAVQRRMGGIYDESYSLNCSATSWSPDENDDTSYADRRATCLAMLMAVRDFLAADPSVGGLVSRAVLGPRVEWQQEALGGAGVSVAFSVRVDAAI